MLTLKIVICILTFSALLIARFSYENDYDRVSNVFLCISAALAITFGILLIASWNLFTIPKILLFASVCIYILNKELWATCTPFWIGILITIIAYIVSGILYLNNLEKAETPDISTTKQTLVAANDAFSINGSMSGAILFVQGSVSEESVYKYYYKLEDGGIKLGTIPADSTTIHFVKDQEDAYLETIVSTSYWLDNNTTPATHCLEIPKTTYKLYVPDGSITNVYEFDLK